MKSIRIIPNKLNGIIKIPPSKSMSHRAIIAAGLSQGKCSIDNITFSNDIIATLEAMKSFGVKAKIKIEDNDGFSSIYIEGKEKLELINNIIDCKESGSTIRFLIPMAGLLGKKVIYTGEGKLVERPLNQYYDIFKEQNINYSNINGKLPLTVEGILNPGTFKIEGNVSSQFITGLLFVLPILSGNSKIIITTEMESKGYIDLTLSILEQFSIEIENKNYREFIIKGNQKYKPLDYSVEGDFSQAAFWIVAGILGDHITCRNININSLQGDKVILDIVKEMGADIHITNDFIETKKSITKGITIDASQCPDLVPILATLGALSKGTTKIINASRLRIKESDRLKSITTELNKLGADIHELEDGLVIHGKENLTGGIVDSWNDHRIAMALAIASIKCIQPVTITNSDAINKSYPRYWHDMISVGGKIV